MHHISEELESFLESVHVCHQQSVDVYSQPERYRYDNIEEVYLAMREDGRIAADDQASSIREQSAAIVHYNQRLVEATDHCYDPATAEQGISVWIQELDRLLALTEPTSSWINLFEIYSYRKSLLLQALFVLKRSEVVLPIQEHDEGKPLHHATKGLTA